MQIGEFPASKSVVHLLVDAISMEFLKLQSNFI